MLEIKLFGTGSAYCFDKPLRFPGHQSFLLLCYLLLNREHILSRERLASIFWGDFPTNTSLKYLRNVLWRLRNVFQQSGAAFDNYIQVDDNNIFFQKNCPYNLDVETFESTIAACQEIPGELLYPEQALRLGEAVNLYSGDLLEGVDGEWCLYERERLSLMNLNTLIKLMIFHRSHNAYRRGLEYGEKILALDNTRETVHREMMMLYWLSGEPARALAQFKHCEQIVFQQFGIQLSDETVQMHQQMLNHQFVPPERPSLVNPEQRIETVEPDLLTEYTLQKIRHFHKVIEETKLELKHLEDVLIQAKLGCK